MKKLKLVDGVIKEPAQGAHRNPEQAFSIVKSEIKKHIAALSKIDADARCEARIDKFCKMGVVK